ncbi:hypothetical protein BDR06DRAFT_954746 [Suillus hirtellus]|nr:hypothetical protein BDR06DRAFT_954746 [Suillus hirtellus]
MYTTAVESLRWSPDGERVVSESFDETARVWDMKNREPILGLHPIKTRYETVYVYAVS